MPIKIGLVGNPNCGKTTMFNKLTDSLQYVGNWPGVTVEKKEGAIKNKKDVTLIDLPGIYSLSAYTLEEVITRDYIIDEKPDIIINIVDASNIERNLYLTTQIIEMGIPTIIALNMMDVVKKRGESINVSKLSKIFGCPIVETSALKGDGLNILIEKALELSNQEYTYNSLDIFSNEVKNALSKIEEIINIYPKRWYSIKILEKDEKVLNKIHLTAEQKQKINDIIYKIEKIFDDKSESIIINERYTYISNIVSKVLNKNNKTKEDISAKIDKILTNKYLGLPIFFIIIYLIYYISVTSLGSIVTDWTNDVLFGKYVTNFFSKILTSLNVSDWVI